MPKFKYYNNLNKNFYSLIKNSAAQQVVLKDDEDSNMVIINNEQTEPNHNRLRIYKSILNYFKEQCPSLNCQCVKFLPDQKVFFCIPHVDAFKVINFGFYDEIKDNLQPKYKEVKLLTPEGEEISHSPEDFVLSREDWILPNYTLILTDNKNKKIVIKNPRIGNLPASFDVAKDGVKDDTILSNCYYIVTLQDCNTQEKFNFQISLNGEIKYDGGWIYFIFTNLFKKSFFDKN